MPISLRIPPEKEKIIREAAAKIGKTMTAYILEAVDDKLGIKMNRDHVIRELAGWLSYDEAEELRSSLEIFSMTN